MQIHASKKQFIIIGKTLFLNEYLKTYLLMWSFAWSQTNWCLWKDESPKPI